VSARHRPSAGELRERRPARAFEQVDQARAAVDEALLETSAKKLRKLVKIGAKLEADRTI
jgi:hypothetical protein